jgi:hypothetical protein
MKRPAVLLAVALLLLSSAFISYRIIWLGYPIFPTTPGKAWQLDMDARVKASEREITVMIGLPSTHAGAIVVEERVTSGKMGFNLLREGPNQVGIWSGAVDTGEEVIAYRATILLSPPRLFKTQPPTLEPYPTTMGKAEQVLAERLVANWDRLAPPARVRAIVATATGVWEKPPPDDRDLRAWSTLQEQHGRLAALFLLLRAAHLPARTVAGLRLAESVNTKLLTWVEAWTGQKWESLQPETGEIYRRPNSFLPLVRGEMPVVRISNGGLSEIRWTLSRQIISQWRLNFERIIRSNRFLDRWSLFRLPPDFQRTFRILLLVPIGALMICVLRNLVGFPTFGIFMPVLMALAFRNTGLAYGLGIFAGVVLIGYVVRRWIDKLRLLLVPRLSVILTLVILCITIFALIGNRLGLREFMAVGLLPFVILTMTIERFFVIVEEAGPREGLWTAAGSAAVATITHEIIHLEPLQLTFFVYPELLFAVAADLVLLGLYKGYRLSELIRFRKLRGSS